MKTLPATLYICESVITGDLTVFTFKPSSSHVVIGTKDIEVEIPPPATPDMIIKALEDQACAISLKASQDAADINKRIEQLKER